MNKISSLHDLKKIFDNFDGDVVFRGQVSHYQKNNKTSIVSSFSRLGCHFEHMQRWMHYCSETIYAMRGPESKELLEPEEMHALLQHYGWRSFYIDATNDPTVAAWFACNKYIGKNNIVLEEDCHERGVCYRLNYAEYQPTDNFGYIYVISKKYLKKHGINLFDLSHLGSNEFLPRYIKQSGVMIGPTEQIPEDAIIDSFQIEYSCLFEFSKHHSTASLFPNRNDDIIYKMLLSTPYEQIKFCDSRKGNEERYFFHRALDIPEYDYKFTKINSNLISFYMNDFAFNKTDDKINAILHAPSHYLFHTTIDTPDVIEELIDFVPVDKVLIVECQGLLRQPAFYKTPHYIKGAYIIRIDNNTIGIGGIDVIYQGTVLHNSTLTMCWHYSIEDNNFIRILQDDDCPCNNNRVHNLLLTIIKKANIDVKDDNYTETSTSNVWKIN